MKIQDLNGKKILVLGFGKEGQATLAAIRKHAPAAEVTIGDRDPHIACDDGSCWLQVGEGWLKNLHHFDVIIKSPGIPPQSEFEAVKGRMTSSTQIFLDTIADSGAMVIGITGSKGKSTTATLIYDILQAAHSSQLTAHSSSLIGNIGEPAISHIDEARKERHGERSRTVFVMEMSSYQLMDLTVSPHIAVVTSFFPEHLDYHASAPLNTGSTPLERYMDAKKHIARFQGSEDVIFYNAASSGAEEIAMESSGTRIPFSVDDCPVPMEQTHLIGDHNRCNIAAAYKVGVYLKIPRGIMMKTIREFRGLPHRLQSLGVHHGIEWIDDAISTTPESTIAALDALGDRVKTIILGGQDRGNDFSGLAQRIKNSSVKTIILFPGSGPRIRDALTHSAAGANIFDAQSMEEAVKLAMRETLTAQSSKLIAHSSHFIALICLLSTASPSYNMFKNFEEKGDAFKYCITECHPE